MIQRRNKKAFSLIEVMIIFTVMAVVMAASIPILQRKTSNPEEVYRHGMFKCVSTQDGKVIQTLYNSSGEPVSIEERDDGSCTFKDIPQKIKFFKVDVYGGGAGGTKYADMRVEHHQLKDVSVRLADLPSILNKSFSIDERVNSAEEGSDGDKWSDSGVAFPLNSGNLIRVLAKSFAGQTVRRSLYTGDGGDGSDASFQYISPSETMCIAAINGLSQLKGRFANRGNEMEDFAKKNWYEFNAKVIYNAMKFISDNVSSYGISGGEEVINKLYNIIYEKKYYFGEGENDYYVIQALPSSLVDEFYIAQHVSSADSSEWYNKVHEDAASIVSYMRYNNKYSYDSSVTSGRDDDYPDDTTSPVEDYDSVGMVDEEYLYAELLKNVFTDDGKYDQDARRPSQYNAYHYDEYVGRPDLMFPVTEVGHQALTDQLNKYCADTFPEYYTEAGGDTKVPKGDSTVIMPPGKIEGTNLWGVKPVQYQDFFMLGNDYSNSQSAYSQALQKGGRGGLGGALVMEYQMGSFNNDTKEISGIPTRYASQWKFVGTSYVCTNTAAWNAEQYERSLSYFSDLYNMTKRDRCGAIPGYKDIFSSQGYSQAANYQTGIVPVMKGEQLSGIAAYKEKYSAQKGKKGENEGAILSYGDVVREVTKSGGGDHAFGGTHGEAPEGVFAGDIGNIYFEIPVYSDHFSTSSSDTSSREAFTQVAQGGKSGYVGFWAPTVGAENYGDWPVWRVWTGTDSGEQPSKSSYSSFGTKLGLKSEAQPGTPGFYSKPIDAYPSDFSNDDKTFDFIRVNNTSAATASNKSGTSVRFGGWREAQFVEPGLVVSGDYWTKKFQLGGPGGSGKHVTYSVYGLGNSCTMHVPAKGGAPLDYWTALASAGNNVNTLVRNYEALRFKTTGGGYATYIECTKKENGGNKIIFQKTVPGGRYSFLNDLTTWTSDTTPKKVLAPADFWTKISSRFSEAIRNLFAGIKSDNEYLSLGGDGTTFNDACQDVQNGNFSTDIYQFTGSSPDYTTMVVGEYLGKAVGDDSDELSNETNGVYNGIKCYERGTLINEGSAEKDGYRLYQWKSGIPGVSNFNAGQGGGGAVIITW